MVFFHLETLFTYTFNLCFLQPSICTWTRHFQLRPRSLAFEANEKFHLVFHQACRRRGGSMLPCFTIMSIYSTHDIATRVESTLLTLSHFFHLFIWLLRSDPSLTACWVSYRSCPGSRTRTSEAQRATNEELDGPEEEKKMDRQLLSSHRHHHAGR